MDPKARTDLLFPKTSFFVGLGSVGSIHGSYFEYNYSETEEESDTKAISSDWKMVGRDIQEAILNFCKVISKDD